MRARRWRPEERMSWMYSACLSLSSPNMRSPRTSEKPMIALSGVRSSCDMFARNSDLWRLAASSSRLLSSSSLKSRAFWIAMADWAASVFRRSTTSGANRPGFFRATTRPPRIRPSRTRGTARTARRPDRVMASRSRLSYAPGSWMSGISTGCRVRATRPSAPSPMRDRSGAQVRHELGVEPLRRAHVEHLLRLVILVDAAAVGAGQEVGARHDGRQHRLDVERRADRLADRAQRLELLHGAREVLRARLQLLEEPGVLDRDDRLAGEGRHELDLLVRERADLATVHHDRPDHLALADQRHAEDRLDPLRPDDLLQLRVLHDRGLRDVLDVHRVPRALRPEHGPAHAILPRPEKLRELPAHPAPRRSVERLPFQPEYGAELRVGKRAGLVEDLVEDGGEVGGRARDDAAGSPRSRSAAPAPRRARDSAARAPGTAARSRSRSPPGRRRSPGA